MVYKRQPRFPRKERPCRFCARQVQDIDYKETAVIRNYVSEGGKILPKFLTGNCSKHQRQMARAIKRARHLALLPFVVM
ncbi:MAG TPA: 30S ribosomal protein S18 [bacterium]|nr:30S ribosomal protein S18 [bacterium]